MIVNRISHIYNCRYVAADKEMYCNSSQSKKPHKQVFTDEDPWTALKRGKLGSESADTIKKDDLRRYLEDETEVTKNPLEWWKVYLLTLI